MLTVHFTIAAWCARILWRNSVASSMTPALFNLPKPHMKSISLQQHCLSGTHRRKPPRVGCRKTFGASQCHASCIKCPPPDCSSVACRGPSDSVHSCLRLYRPAPDHNSVACKEPSGAPHAAQAPPTYTEPQLHAVQGNMLAPNTQRGVQATTSRLFSKAKWGKLLQISTEQQHHSVQAPHGVS